jgi:asparagine synthase (glutamine-hydrolysing)
MCGLAGIFTKAPDLRPDLDAAVRNMSNQIRHRGPDDHGTWVDSEAGVAFGFRRLSIIDLSEHGHQPMHSRSGRFTVIFNGEIYNFSDLRSELDALGHDFRGNSDTEVLLAAMEEWGVIPAIRRCIGMFAIALWDNADHSLWLIRDRLGVKPLFVSKNSACIAFASELKALMASPRFDRSVDPDSLSAYLRYLYVPAPSSIFRCVRKILPGHAIQIRHPSQPIPESKAYWSLTEAATRGLGEPLDGSEEEVLREAEHLLEDSVRLRLRSDVPLGALLSGGIDSSLIVAIMQGLSNRPVKTYSVAFQEEDYDEAPDAARVAEFLGTEHTEITLTPDETLGLIPRLPEVLDEPFASPSAIPNFLVCQLARSEVTVALSGTGGDEIFGGYNRYTHGARMIRLASRTPWFLRRALAGAVRRVPHQLWESLGNESGPVPKALRYRYAERKAEKLARLLAEPSMAKMYRSLVSAWQDPSTITGEADVQVHPGARPLSNDWLAGNRLETETGIWNRCMLADQLGYLADDQLAKVDRVSMAVSLELRVPLLDHRLVEFSWRLPPAMKIRDRQGKWILRRLLYRRVPQELIDRPKMGLSVPIERWLRGPLRGWAEDLLKPNRIGEDGLLRPQAIQKSWVSFQAGETGLDLAMWAVLMYQSWRERWLA